MAEWLTLFARAMAIMDAAPPDVIPPDWTIGGGTMLFRRFGHRIATIDQGGFDPSWAEAVAAIVGFADGFPRTRSPM